MTILRYSYTEVQLDKTSDLIQTKGQSVVVFIVYTKCQAQSHNDLKTLIYQHNNASNVSA